ncbi:NAD(P)-dependent iron-only hydrogenase diaphorase component iron-sulfur protein [Thermodesulfitimonas autotrophica]|uniref:NAD(P)-dependent iron-only hydrogenase diaphorase component iron-sulfur protein n=1 Tax=Thermodesulfitimonas autotrophica TaxID=1894989 RepID=A0A3N5AGS0_9THEO|nr:NAD(P)H-dependent oxidoreductase subunit E [Thermodesulfitimonas autotrophica]RPF43050.1 NAD(P)-dependent iron-only hydrogenase diaphorase component iron-sulfur protein [Thermodesulfitimonas autotrophica]
MPEINPYARLDRFIRAYAEKPGGLVRVLQKAQEIFGYLSPEVQTYVARQMKLPASTVAGVATFYSQFAAVPQGKNVINVCLGTACYVKGSGEIFAAFKKLLGVDADETTPDGLFTLRATRCLGACSIAPVVTVNEAVFAHATPETAAAIVARYRKEGEERKDAAEYAGLGRAAATPPPPA